MRYTVTTFKVRLEVCDQRARRLWWIRNRVSWLPCVSLSKIITGDAIRLSLRSRQSSDPQRIVISDPLRFGLETQNQKRQAKFFARHQFSFGSGFPKIRALGLRSR